MEKIWLFEVGKEKTIIPVKVKEVVLWDEISSATVELEKQLMKRGIAQKKATKLACSAIVKSVSMCDG